MTPPEMSYPNAPESAPGPPGGRFKAATGLDRVIHERSRLALLALLAARGSASFSQMRRFLELSDGNLASHLRVLEEANLVRVHKEHLGRRPQSVAELTWEGKRQFKSYLDQLESVIRSARSGLSERPLPLSPTQNDSANAV